MPGNLGLLFQLGAILGAKYRFNLDAFGNAFLGATGSPGAVGRYFSALADDLLWHSITDSTTFGNFVDRDYRRRIGFAGDDMRFFRECGMNKISLEQAVDLAWQYANDGAALGAVRPEIVTDVFDRSHAVVPKEQWDLARLAGLDIPQEQPVMSYTEVENGENETFLAYCQQCCPDLYPVLNARAVDSLRHNPPATSAENSDLEVRSSYPEIGLEIPWVNVIRHLFRVLNSNAQARRLVQPVRFTLQLIWLFDCGISRCRGSGAAANCSS